MGTSEGTRLAQTIRKNLEEMNRVCKGLEEAMASQAPAGRWSPKEIISHLLGPEGIGIVPALNAILKVDTPRLDMEAADPYFSGKRKQTSFEELLFQFNGEYERIAQLAAGLPAEQLARKAHIPLFKETPIGEYPTLAIFIGALGSYHLEDHINHMKEILQLLGFASTAKV